MLTLDKLKALRGCSSAQNNAENDSDKTQNLTSNTPESVLQQQQANQPQNDFMLPVEVPCKHYDDENGHFAYIDAHTKAPVHFNTLTGKSYNQDEINQLSLGFIIKNLPESAKSLNCDDIITDNTLYDRFGSPVFTEAEITNAMERKTANTFNNSENKDNSDTLPKVDAFGFPI